MSNHNVPIEKIADLIGQRTMIVTRTVYQYQLKPVIEAGAITMNTIFDGIGKTEPTSRPAPHLALILALTARYTFEKCGPYWI